MKPKEKKFLIALSKVNLHEVLRLLGVNIKFDNFGIPSFPEGMFSGGFQLSERVLYLKFNQTKDGARLDVRVTFRDKNDKIAHDATYLNSMFCYFSYLGKTHSIWGGQVYK